jgi:hypothetical protein
VEEFVAAVDQLARQRRAAGSRQAAQRVAELLEAGAALQQTQQAALNGQPGPTRRLRTPTPTCAPRSRGWPSGSD